MNDKVICLGDKLTINGVPHQVSAIISPIGELTVAIINLKTGRQTANIMLDAVAGFALYEAQHAFYRGEFEEEMNETL